MDTSKFNPIKVHNLIDWINLTAILSAYQNNILEREGLPSGYARLGLEYQIALC